MDRLCPGAARARLRCAVRRLTGTAVRRAAAALADDAIVLAAFNAPYKREPDAFALWCEMLRRLPSACLWLRAAATVEDRLRAAAARHGVDGARLIFAP